MAVILVVDDEESIRRLIAMLLESKGHKVLTAANGAEAVAVYRSFSDQIDLTVTDMNMPTMDGLQEILRIRMTNPDAKFICITGDSAEQCPDDIPVFAKPLDIPGLLSCVEDMVRPRHDSAA